MTTIEESTVPLTGAPPLPRTDVPPGLPDKLALAEQLAMAQGSLFPEWLRGKSANFLAVMFAGQALDIPLWTATQGLYAEGGSVGVEAHLMRALVQRAGHLIYVEDASPFHATVVLIRWNVPDRPYRATFTMEEAVRAGLSGQKSYQSYPEQQMIARATSRVCREGAADVLNGFVYTPEELANGFRQDKTPAAPPPADVDQMTVDKLCEQIGQADDLADLKRVWKATAKAGALMAYCEGETLVSKLQARFAQVAPGQQIPAATIATPVAAPASTTHTSVTIEQLAPCGCTLTRFTETGTHEPGCPEYTAPVPAPAKRAPRKATPKGTGSK